MPDKANCEKHQQKTEEHDRNLAALFLALSIVLSILESTVNKEGEKRIWTSIAFELTSLLFFTLNYLFFLSYPLLYSFLLTLS